MISRVWGGVGCLGAWEMLMEMRTMMSEDDDDE